MSAGVVTAGYAVLRIDDCHSKTVWLIAGCGTEWLIAEVFCDDICEEQGAIRKTGVLDNGISELEFVRI